MKSVQRKSFWKRPEGKTGLIVLLALLAGAGFLVASSLGAILSFLTTMAGTIIGVVALAALVFVLIDSKARNLVWYMYKSAMRWLTSLFVKIDPIAILRSYVEDLEENISKMAKQMAKLRGQMHQLNEIIFNNKKSIQTNLELASKAKESDKRSAMVLRTRKAGRLKESNMKLEDLHKKMEVMYRVLRKMHENSTILKEDIKDQVMVKEQEQKAIHASHSAMKSAMSVISGDPDKRAMFDAAMDAIAEDVASKVGEMERFMEVSANFMDSIDLQNGVFEEEGLKMLEKWETESESLLLGGEKIDLLLEAEDESNILDLEEPLKEPLREKDHRNQYDSFFD